MTSYSLNPNFLSNDRMASGAGSIALWIVSPLFQVDCVWGGCGGVNGWHSSSRR